MKLFVDSNYLSPYAMSVFVGLREKSLNFETRLVDLDKAENHSSHFAGLAITQRVPAIDDKGFRLCESSAICEYLEDTYPGLLLYPQNLTHKAKAREIQAWLRSDLMAIREERTTDFVFLKPVAPALSDKAKLATTKLFSAAEQLIPVGSNSLFAQWCIADTDLALMLNRLIFAGDPVPARLAEFAAFQWQRPSVQEWVKLANKSSTKSGN
ncbi:glutathione transferase [Paraglaciecola sp.]|uniref:glutathione transferase n=1 Tax=Paraglaciecola sp. TaxID=1920173 RepID=UPI0030F41EFF